MFSQESAPLAPIISQKNLVQLSYPISVRSILISLRPARGSSKWSPFRLYYQSPTRISLFHACHMHCPSFYSLFDRSNNISRRVQITRLQIMTFSAACCSCLMSKYFLFTPCSRTQFAFVLRRESRFHAHSRR